MDKSSLTKQTTASEISHFKLSPYVDNMREMLCSSKLKLQLQRRVKKNKTTNEEAQTIQKLTEENTKLTEQNATLIALLEEKNALLVKKREPCDCLVHVFVRESMNNSTTSLDVKRSDTIKEVKAKFLHKQGLHKAVRPSSFHVTHERGGRLRDEQTVAHCDIESGSTLDLEFRCGLGSPYLIDVRVSMLRGESIALLRSSSHDTVKDLKLIIQDETGIDAYWQELTFDGRKLDRDTCILFHYDIKGGSTTICLDRRNYDDDTIRVCVTNVTQTKKITLKVERFDTIGYVKKKIRYEKGMPLEGDGSFVLVFQGSCLDEDRTVGYYNIIGESTLYVVSRIVGDGNANNIKSY